MQFPTIKEAIEFLLTQGYTKYAIAKKINCSPTMINHYLRGVRISEKGNLALHKAFRVSVQSENLRNPGSPSKVNKEEEEYEDNKSVVL